LLVKSALYRLFLEGTYLAHIRVNNDDFLIEDLEGLAGFSKPENRKHILRRHFLEKASGREFYCDDTGGNVFELKPGEVLVRVTDPSPLAKLNNAAK